MTEDDLDGSGWDLRKTVKLLAKSNAPLLEWLYSPVVYYENEAFITQMRDLAKECFSPIACLHHYLGTTKNFMDVCEQEHVKLKSYFYALRTALAGKWIIENNCFPPVDFLELLPIAPTEIQEKVKELMTIKANQDESYLHPKEVLITTFLQETVKFNQDNGITPKTIIKEIKDGIEKWKKAEDFTHQVIGESDEEYRSKSYVASLKSKMEQSAAALEFDKAAYYRDKIREFEKSQGAMASILGNYQETMPILPQPGKGRKRK